MLKPELKHADDVVRYIQKVAKQVPFATSKALNETAKLVQRHEINEELPNNLKLRGQWLKPGTRFGINIRFSNKTRLEAVVGTRANWIALVEKGGTKTPPKKALAIPTTAIDTSRPRRKKDKPAQILGQKGAFIAKMKSGKAGIFRRVGQQRLPIQAIYFFDDSARVPDVLDFFESGKQVADKEFIRIFPGEFAKAVANTK